LAAAGEPIKRIAAKAAARQALMLLMVISKVISTLLETVLRYPDNHKLGPTTRLQERRADPVNAGGALSEHRTNSARTRCL
jgi:hypothetical protein